MLLPIGHVFHDKDLGWFRVVGYFINSYGRKVEDIEPCDEPPKPEKATKASKPAEQAKSEETPKPPKNSPTFRWPDMAKKPKPPKAPKPAIAKAASKQTAVTRPRNTKSFGHSFRDYVALAEVIGVGALAFTAGPLAVLPALAAIGYAHRKRKKKRKPKAK
jgi:hypothetical protein